MSVSPDRLAKMPLALLLLGAAALAAGCAPERVDMNVHDIFTGDAARYALQTQMSPSLLASVGGFLPASTWPSDAAPLLLDVVVIAENKIDLTGSNIDVSPYSALRLHWAQLNAAALSQGPLAPLPTKVEIYVGPSAATALTDPGVSPLASGAFPDLAAAASCDGGPDCASDPGTTVLGGTNPRHFDDGGTSDAGSDDAGNDDAGTSDAGNGDDAGPVASGADAGQTLVFSSDAELSLQKLVLAGQPFSLFVVLHMPIDSAFNPALPTGGADLSFDIQFELAR